ncbi:hypothetical protein NE857_05810 [Nocardiopsis exhalans]|uniref:Uncharacterized protein n=1 Tax=Nocardiopsis exhalans TaxID=163604 RepID=A0ABY5DDN3_9ACTN|nr:hypothetical protein [Nocardiopsis exhalans]USY21155.1 hypothetical protein NE857_05810 [Nocardiopsis exhalans]
MTGSYQVSSGVRQRLAAPRGHRFSRPGTNRQLAAPPESHQDRQERLLRQMEGNPHLAYRLQHHAVPHWAKATRQRRERVEREPRRPAPLPHGPARGRHRAPRQWWAWPAVAISIALLFTHSQAESLGEAVFQGGGLVI